MKKAIDSIYKKYHAIIIMVIIVPVLCVFFAMCFFHISPSNNNSSVLFPANIMIEGKRYYPGTQPIIPSVPEGYELSGHIKSSINGLATESFQGCQVAEGAEVYSSDTNLGWIYVSVPTGVKQFVAWELCCDLLQYNGSIYISIKDLNQQKEAEPYHVLKYQKYSSKSYSCVGTLAFGTTHMLPTCDFETNSGSLLGAELWCNPEDFSTLYVMTGSSGDSQQIPFYNTETLSLDLSNYSQYG